MPMSPDPLGVPPMGQFAGGEGTGAPVCMLHVLWECAQWSNHYSTIIVVVGCGSSAGYVQNSDWSGNDIFMP